MLAGTENFRKVLRKMIYTYTCIYLCFMSESKGKRASTVTTATKVPVLKHGYRIPLV